MEEACKTHKSVKFINLFPYHKEIHGKFLDQNPKTIHLRYLPTIIELAKHVPNIKIDMKKSLEIENEYVDEKTKRYERNLQILEERKWNESMSESGSQSRKSSKEVYDEQYSTS